MMRFCGIRNDLMVCSLELPSIAADSYTDILLVLPSCFSYISVLLCVCDSWTHTLSCSFHRTRLIAPLNSQGNRIVVTP